MSDRREAVATALRRVFDIHQAGAFMVTAPDYVPRPNAWHYELADVALSAIDAEPTEAEVEATCPECGGHGRGCSFCGGTGDWPRTSEPTEAEIIAAALAYESAFNHPKGHWKIYQHDDPRATYKPGGFKFETMRAALLAARNARHE